MKWEIFHRTRYRYASPVRESFNEVRVRPVTNEHQTLDSFLLKVLPAARLQHYEDFYANCIHHFELPEPHDTLLIEANSVVTTRPPATLAFDAMPAPLSRLPEALRSERCFDYLQASHFVDLSPETWRLALDATDGQTDIWQSALAIMRFVYGNFRYEPSSTGVHTHIREVIEQRRGVCQDFAHVMLGLCRSVKIPALYVSGYLATETASATHAWVEVFIPGHGWRALDPTHNSQPGETYVKIAVGRDYADVPPVSGHYKGTTDRRMDVEVQIRSLA
ncbi:MAG: transglutaminase family protein [Verrucomicrobia bacterium]|nr:transglutaminase family protein [Verrucomicrobiota bacterium]